MAKWKEPVDILMNDRGAFETPLGRLCSQLRRGRTLSFLCVNILENCHVPHAAPSSKGQRLHECERGTHECVRHTDFNI
jgi:hypothetical protein